MLRLASDEAGAARQQASAERWLTAVERRHAAELRRLEAAVPRRRALGYVVSRAACRLMLAAELDVAPFAVELSRDQAGAPRAAPPHGGAALSLAHSPRHVACAVSAPFGLGLGVDVEEADRFAAAPAQPLRLARRYLHARTFAALTPLGVRGQAQAFLRAWTVVEAVGKAHGVGLVLPLRHAEVALAELTGPGAEDAPRWLRVRVDAAGETHVAALTWPDVPAADAPIVSLACHACHAGAGGRPQLVAHAALPFA